MYYEPGVTPHGLPHDPFKSCVVPRPIGWISTVDAQGRDNLAPVSQFQNVTFDPPIVMFSAQQTPRVNARTRSATPRRQASSSGTWRRTNSAKPSTSPASQLPFGLLRLHLRQQQGCHGCHSQLTRRCATGRRNPLSLQRFPGGDAVAADRVR